MKYYFEVLRKYTDFNGRARRPEFWFFYLFNIILSIIPSLFGFEILSSIYALFILIPSVAVGVRRMHDIGKSGWYILIPVYSFILALKKGDEVTNKYGEVPVVIIASDKLLIFTKGLIKENPVLIMLLGLCPALGVTTSAFNGFGMGLATLFVLVMSNLVVSIIKNLIPAKVRIPSFIVIIASFVTIVELVLEGFIPALYDSLGLFIPLIVVNCLVLGRAEAFASKNTVFSSLVDGLGMGLGFTLALTILGGVREIFGSGSLFGFNLGFFPLDADGNPIVMLVFVLAPGAFIALGYLVALNIMIKEKMSKK
jgi:Na+-translocating ferredoxin:NAD+ oxidoreductase subunit E